MATSSSLVLSLLLMLIPFSPSLRPVLPSPSDVNQSILVMTSPIATYLFLNPMPCPPLFLFLYGSFPFSFLLIAKPAWRCSLPFITWPFSPARYHNVRFLPLPFPLLLHSGDSLFIISVHSDPLQTPTLAKVKHFFFFFFPGAPLFPPRLGMPRLFLVTVTSSTLYLGFPVNVYVYFFSVNKFGWFSLPPFYHASNPPPFFLFKKEKITSWSLLLFLGPPRLDIAFIIRLPEPFLLY